MRIRPRLGLSAAATLPAETNRDPGRPAASFPRLCLEHVKLRCSIRQTSPDPKGSLARCLLYALIIIYLQTVLLLSGIWLDQEGEERGSIFAVARRVSCEKAICKQANSKLQ